jgi:hypothetical protein
MKIAAFNAVCPYEIGDRVRMFKPVVINGVVVDHESSEHTITDIQCIHSLKTGKVKFEAEFDNSGKYYAIE